MYGVKTWGHRMSGSEKEPSPRRRKSEAGGNLTQCLGLNISPTALNNSGKNYFFLLNLSVLIGKVGLITVLILENCLRTQWENVCKQLSMMPSYHNFSFSSCRLREKTAIQQAAIIFYHKDEGSGLIAGTKKTCGTRRLSHVLEI